jgi:hypothetical protein
MTHNGFIRLLESNSTLLDNANVIVDENLDRFNTHEFMQDELDRIQRVIPEVGSLFPYSTLACKGDLAGWNLQPGRVDTFASRNYVFRDEQAASSLSDVYDSLRRAVGMGLTVDPFKASPGDLERAQEVLLSLMNVFRPSRAGDATYAYREVHDLPTHAGNKYVVKRSRFSLETDRAWRRMWILNASAQLSPVPYPEKMNVYACPDLKSNSHLVTLRVVSANPMASSRDSNILTSGVIQWLSGETPGGRHRNVFVAVSKSEKGLDTVKAQIAKLLGPDVSVVVRSRGRIKGINDAGDCTLANLTAMSLFTTIDDCALYAALAIRRSFPDMPHVFSYHRMPNMPGGRFQVPAMQEYYALSSLDQIYQAIWRTAVRNGRPVEAIVAIPEPAWLVALWRTVMPGFVLGDARRVDAATEEELAAYRNDLGVRRDLGHLTPERYEELMSVPPVTHTADQAMLGLQIVNAPPGTEIGKTEIAVQFGYTGKTPWKTNKARIMALLAPFFGEGSTDHTLRRR